jgi:hypothetical protein
MVLVLLRKAITYLMSCLSVPVQLKTTVTTVIVVLCFLKQKKARINCLATVNILIVQISLFKTLTAALLSAKIFKITLKFKTRMNCSNKEVYVTANTQQIKNLIHASFKMSFQTLQLQFKAIKIVMK